MITMQPALNQNPYTSMLLTYNSQRFYGRENEVIGILQVITGTEPNSHAIYGIRTIGKTTLLKFLKDPDGALRHYEQFISHEYLAGSERRLLFVYTHFHNFREGDSVFFFMLSQLYDDLQDHEIEVNLNIHLYNHSTPRHDLVNALRVALNHLHQLAMRVVFLMDDFDTPLQHVDDIDDGLLRTLSDFACLIIATEDPIVELRPDLMESSPLLGILRPGAIGLINEEGARRLVKEPAQAAGMQFTDDEADLLLRLAGRQPFLLTAACELYFGMRREYPDIRQHIQEPGSGGVQTQFLARLLNMPHVEQVLQITWKRLDDEERLTLQELAKNPEHNFQIEYATITAKLSNKALVYWDYQNNVYRIFSRLFAEFVRQTPRFARAATPPTHARNRTLSDHLAPIDRALLDYFMDHSGQVCTFNQILDAVWEDADKSKRALEAAVHRLRRHLGDEAQIKSIRGKGYKFMPEKVAARN